MRERRRYTRSYTQTLTGELSLGRWPRRRSWKASIRDVSRSGVGLQLEPDAPIDGKRVTLRWDVPASVTGTGKPYSLRMAGTAIAREKPGRFGVRFDRLVDEEVAVCEAGRSRLTSVLAAVALAALLVLLKSRNVVSFWYEPAFQVYSLVAAAYVLSRLLLSTLYREPADQGHYPTVTIVISVKNEEKHIARSVDALFKLRYPKTLYEVLIVDDGSTDGTWNELEALRARHERLRTFKFETNRGKRHGMALGAREAAGEIVVFIDSDSVLEAEGLYRILQPFVDPRVGAVAGHTLVLDADHFLAKMESVRYYVSQRVIKAAESFVYSVTCCPGPFSAYRRAAVMRVLPEWETQRFLGTEATFGDDRSLTNYILRDYRVLYHAGARAATYVPEQWSMFFKQQLRWKKSFVRETTIAVRHMWRRHPVAALSYYIGVAITVCSPVIALRALLYLPAVAEQASYLPYILGVLLVYLLYGLIYRFHARASLWYYGAFFAVLYVFVLAFQNYYAVLTVRRNHWGTR